MMGCHDGLFRHGATCHVDVDVLAELPQQAQLVFAGYLEAALDEMERACGSLEAYLEQAIGLGPRQRDELHEHFLE